ncbi:MAG: family 78 glycoside hydrolase catalytic domain [Phycisphaeraceae bacterium]|nr:family 78 glycoside hydrolase catalytic domain [Phycisphaeraceae bacterium]
MTSCTIQPTRLTCEMLTNPLALPTIRPRLSWVAASVDDTARGVKQSAYQIRAATEPSLLDRPNLWDSGKVAQTSGLHIDYAGRPRTAFGVGHWQVRLWDQHDQASPWSEPACWAIGPQTFCDWDQPGPAGGSPAWIGEPVPADWHDLTSYPAALLRRGFVLSQGVRRAVLYASAKGLYELRLNGEKAGNQELAPEWTDYNQRTQYQAYDVTAMLRAGDNVIAGILADGWACGRIGLSWIAPNCPWRGIYLKRPRLLAMLRVELADGSVTGVVSDGRWRYSTHGPIRAADILEGEVVDARRTMAGWDRPGFDDTAWSAVTTEPRREGELVPQMNEPIRATRELSPVKMAEPQPGVHVFDMGQNFAGRCRLRLRHLPAGTEVRLRHAEALSPDGMIYRDNLRIKPGEPFGAPQEDRYIAAGQSVEDFEPRFTYHGFRYVEVTGLPVRPDLDDLTGVAVHSAPRETLELTCSEPAVNRLLDAIRWTLRSNLHSIPTDCPQRDERLGWMGDMQVFAQTAGFLMDMGAFFAKWCADIRDAQCEDGRFPDFAPHPFGKENRFHANPGWGDAGVLVPWRSWVNFADWRLLETHYDAMRRWIDLLAKRNPEGLWLRGRGVLVEYGDWLNGDTMMNVPQWPGTGGEVPKPVYATAFYAHSTQTLARIAAVLGREEDRQRYDHLARHIRQSFLSAFVQDDGTIAGDTQAGYAMALNFDLLPEPLRPLAVNHMRRALERYGNRLSTGIQSTIRIMNELTRWGMADLAYDVLLDRRIPSWLYMMDHGGTTVWERWDGYVEGREPSPFQHAGMNSFNHYAIGAVGQWMVQTMGGLRPDEDAPGYARFILQPVPDPRGRITWAKLNYDSPRGPIGCAWQRQEQGLDVQATVPPGAIASLHLPAREVRCVTESGRLIDAASPGPGMTLRHQQPGDIVIELEGGTYRFHVADV